MANPYIGETIGRIVSSLGGAIINKLKDNADKEEASSALQDYLKKRYTTTGNDPNNPYGGEITGVNPEATSKLLQQATDNPYIHTAASTLIPETFNDWQKREAWKERQTGYDRYNKEKEEAATASRQANIDMFARNNILGAIKDIRQGRSKLDSQDEKVTVPFLAGTIQPNQEDYLSEVARAAYDPSKPIAPELASTFTSKVIEKPKAQKPILRINQNTGVMESRNDQGVWIPDKTESGDNAMLGRVKGRGHGGVGKLSQIQKMQLDFQAKYYADQLVGELPEYATQSDIANYRNNWRQAYNEHVNSALSHYQTNTNQRKLR